MKIGRSEPCPCGSGKKYKKCCLLKEPAPPPDAERDTESEAREEDAASAPSAPPPAEEPSPEERRWEHFWEALGEASPERKLEMAREVIGAEESFDGELAFDLVDALAEPLRRTGKVVEL